MRKGVGEEELREVREKEGEIEGQLRKEVNGI